jgi:hypothetical protein
MNKRTGLEGGSLPGPGRAAAVWPRRRVLQLVSAVGVGSAVFGRALVALAADRSRVTAKMIRQAEWVSGLELGTEKREMMLSGVNDLLKDFETIRAVELDNSVPPALFFFSEPGRPSGPVATPYRPPAGGRTAAPTWRSPRSPRWRNSCGPGG